MSFNISSWLSYIPSLARSLCRGPDKSFIDVLDRAAQKSGSSQGRNYLVISAGKLGLSPKKSEEVPFEKLTEFVNGKLKGLPEQDVAIVKEDLSKIGAEYLRQSQVKFNMDPDALRQVLDFLPLKDIASSAAVSSTWNKDLNIADQRVWKAKLEEIAFGPKKWNTFFGDVGEVPLLPKDIVNILKSPCPFWPDKKVVETQMLVLIPKTVNGQPLTLRSLRELVKHPKEPGNKTDYEYISDQLLTEHGDKPIEASHWVLMTKDVLPESRNKSYAVQRELVTAKPSYDVPKLLPAAVCILMEYVSTGTVLYGRGEQWTYTRCQEQVDGHQTVVGGFAPSGLSFSNDFFGIVSVAVGPTSLLIRHFSIKHRPFGIR